MANRKQWERFEQELDLLRREIDRQHQLDPSSHDSDCACWACIGQLQAAVVQAYIKALK
jgi:hypothetical protein